MARSTDPGDLRIEDGSDSSTSTTNNRPTGSHTANNEEDENKDGCIAEVVKWVVRIILVILTVGFLVFGKLSFLTLAQDIRNQSQLTGQCPKAQAYWRMYWVLMIPLLLTFSRCLWRVFRQSNKDFPRPKGKLIRKLIIFSLLESACVSIFAFFIAVELDNSALVVVLQSTLFIPTILTQLKTHFDQRPGGSESRALEESIINSNTTSQDSQTWSKRLEKSPRIQMVLDVIALVIQIGALGGLTAIIVIRSYSSQISVLVIVVTTMIVLSFVWWSKSQYFFLTKGGSEDHDDQADDHDDSDAIKDRWKVGIGAAVCKMVFTTVAMIVIIRVVEGEDYFTSESSNCLWWYGPQHMTANNAFVINACVSLGPTIMALVASAAEMQKWVYPSLILATPVTISLLIGRCYSSWLSDKFQKIGFRVDCNDRLFTAKFVLTVSIVLVACQTVCSLRHILKQKMIPLVSEEQLFIQPTYSSVFTEQFLLLNRKINLNLRRRRKAYKRATNATVYICTTMYRENAEEQQRVLESLVNVDKMNAKTEASSNKDGKLRNATFEVHIVFDGGAENNKVVKPHATTLLDLVKKKVNEECDTFEVPYGLQIKTTFPNKTELYIHLKDVAAKVKQNKRWSQIMYLSYITQFRRRAKDSSHASNNGGSGESKEKDHNKNKFILMTDGDVSFNYEAVERLLDILQADLRVGAVCGRINPIGSGPLVWYQKFDYAIGHWFQKAAEHVLGTVTCIPGCFSLYKVEAVEEVLATYRSKVEKADDFLKKDMGEDRWLSTLLVLEGWRLEYCSFAHIDTQCPTSFHDFFNQRRRWITSTMVNQFQLCSHGSQIVKKNSSVSMLFILYQSVMVFASIIAPSTVILIISAGLAVTYDVNQVAMLVVLLLLSLGYGACCLLGLSQKFQISVAKLLTAIFSFLMGAVVIALLLQCIRGFNRLGVPIENPSVLPNSSSTKTPTTYDASDIALSTYYVLGLAALYIAAALLHPPEVFCLLQSVWYLLCLPCGYLVLTIYAVCNLHIQAWGTREKNEEKDKEYTLWDIKIWSKLLYDACCCKKKTKRVEIQFLAESTRRLHDQNRNKQIRNVEEPERQFWKELVRDRLACKDSESKESKEKIKKLASKLVKMRNRMVLLFFITNSLWILLIVSIALHSELNVRGNNYLGLLFLAIYGLTTVIQFVGMVWHRLVTLIHWMARVQKHSAVKQSQPEQQANHSKTQGSRDDDTGSREDHSETTPLLGRQRPNHKLIN